MRSNKIMTLMTQCTSHLLQNTAQSGLASASHTFKDHQCNAEFLMHDMAEHPSQLAASKTTFTLCVRGLSGLGLSQKGPIGVFRDLLGGMMEHVLQIGVPGISQDQWKWCN